MHGIDKGKLLKFNAYMQVYVNILLKTLCN